MTALQKRIAGYEEESDDGGEDLSLALTSGRHIGRIYSTPPGGLRERRRHVYIKGGSTVRKTARLPNPIGAHAPLSEQTRQRRRLMSSALLGEDDEDDLSLFDSKSMDDYSDDDDDEDAYQIAGDDYDSDDDDLSGDEVYYAGDAAVHGEAEKELEDLMAELREEYPSEGRYMDSGIGLGRLTRKGRARRRGKKAVTRRALADFELTEQERKRKAKELKATRRHERKMARKGKSFVSRLKGGNQIPSQSPLDQARTATEYHEIASYLTDPRPSEVDWEETSFPFSLNFSLKQAAENPKVAQWNLIDVVKNNKAIRKLMGSGNYLGDVVVHDIRHNAPVSLGIRASMQATTDRPSDNSEIFYAANVYPTKISMSPVHVQINKSLPNMPQSASRMALRTRPAAVAPTFMDRYVSEWSLSQVREDAEPQSGKGVSLVSSKSPLVGLLLAKNILHPSVVNERTSVPMDENMVKDGLDMIEADHNTVLRLGDLSAMRLSAVRVSGDHWEHSDEITNDLRVGSASERATIAKTRIAAPFVIEGTVTVSHGRILPHQPTPEELAQVQHNSRAQGEMDAANQQQILMQTAAETIQAHDYNAMNDAAKKAGILVHEPQPEQAETQVQRYQDPETGVIYNMVPVAQNN